MANITKAQQARIEKVLNVRINYSNYGIKTRREWLELMKWEGATVEETDQPRIKYNRRKYNRMDMWEQREYDEKLKERKPLYKLNAPNCPHNSFWEITKIEYDYFLTIETQFKPS